MPTKDELLQAINNLERQDASLETCQKLAIYHQIYDIYYGGRKIVYNSDSEFMKATENTDLDVLYSVFDELMDCLKLINPKLYDSVLVKLKNA